MVLKLNYERRVVCPAHVDYVFHTCHVFLGRKASCVNKALGVRTCVFRALEGSRDFHFTLGREPQGEVGNDTGLWSYPTDVTPVHHIAAPAPHTQSLYVCMFPNHDMLLIHEKAVHIYLRCSYTEYSCFSSLKGILPEVEFKIADNIPGSQCSFTFWACSYRGCLLWSWWCSLYLCGLSISWLQPLRLFSLNKADVFVFHFCPLWNPISLFSLQSTHRRMCVSECPSGFFRDDRKRCKKCSSSCETCVGSRSDQCTTCRTGFHLSEGSNTCVANCADSFYLDHGMFH